MRKILVIEDDRNIRNVLTYNLQSNGYEVLEADNGIDGYKIAISNDISLILMDVMMNGLNGFECTRKIREFSDVPIIFITALEDEMDKVNGFDSGADDYVTKPFGVKELLARINVHLRKRGNVNGSMDKLNITKNVVLNKAHKNVEVNGEVKDLSATEYNLLKYLCENPNSVFSRHALLSEVWGYNYGDTRTVDVAVCRLREKLEKNPNRPEIIKTRRGFGYYCTLAI